MQLERLVEAKRSEHGCSRARVKGRCGRLGGPHLLAPGASRSAAYPSLRVLAFGKRLAWLLEYLCTLWTDTRLRWSPCAPAASTARTPFPQLPLVSIAEHQARHENGGGKGSSRVIGVLFGHQEGLDIHIAHSYELVVQPDGTTVDIAFLAARRELSALKPRVNALWLVMACSRVSVATCVALAS